MKMLFKQKFFSWFDRYDIYDEEGNILYYVQGELSLGHQLRIYDFNHQEVGLIKEKALTLLPKFTMYVGDQEVGKICGDFSLFTPKFHLTCNDWLVTGDIFEWDYKVVNSKEEPIMMVSKKIWQLTDTYVIDVFEEQNALYSLMIVLAIDAAKCHNS